MRMIVLCWLAFCALLPFSSTASADDDLSPALQAALSNLTSPEYGMRQKAAHAIEKILARQTIALAAVDDPESQSRLISLLEYGDSLTRFTIDLLSCPMDERAGLRELFAQADFQPIVGKLFSPAEDARVEGVKQLAARDGIGVDFLLGRLVSDSSAPSRSRR